MLGSSRWVQIVRVELMTSTVCFFSLSGCHTEGCKQQSKQMTSFRLKSLARRHNHRRVCLLTSCLDEAGLSWGGERACSAATSCGLAAPRQDRSPPRRWFRRKTLGKELILLCVVQLTEGQQTEQAFNLADPRLVLQSGLWVVGSHFVISGE